MGIVSRQNNLENTGVPTETVFDDGLISALFGTPKFYTTIICICMYVFTYVHMYVCMYVCMLGAIGFHKSMVIDLVSMLLDTESRKVISTELLKMYAN